ncbi:MAG: MGMT family protein [Ruminiclostridium sp.]|nr:MGMT family protein [Ruminiclostridium sp.]
MTEFNFKVYKITAAIPKGKVATYGQIAAILGIPTAARAVGTALRNTPAGLDIPCHRVVNKAGAMAPGEAFGGAGNQRRLLEEEGVVFKPGGTIDMKRHLLQNKL